MGGLGSKDLARYIKTGEQLLRSIAIRAKCAECTANYADGRYDWEICKCPLYPFMPYHGKTAKIELNLVGGECSAQPP